LEHAFRHWPKHLPTRETAHFALAGQFLVSRPLRRRGPQQRLLSLLSLGHIVALHGQPRLPRGPDVAVPGQRTATPASRDARTARCPGPCRPGGGGPRSRS